MAGLKTRVEKLEADGAGGTVDLVAEAAAYGERLWQTDGGRAYLSADGSTLTAIGAHGTVRYEVPGVDLRETV